MSYIKLRNTDKYNKLIMIFVEGTILKPRSIFSLYNHKAYVPIGKSVDIIKEWQELTKEINCDIVVIDFPLLDTRVDAENLVGKFISDIVLQVLSFVAQNERENIRQRQREGIRIAKEKGIHMGRPRMVLPNNFEEIASKYYKKEITNVNAAKKLNMARTTFLKYAKEYKIKHMK